MLIKMFITFLYVIFDMIQSYYDSDEDVYWGPVSLPELKRHAMSTRSKEDIESRRTIHCDPSFLDNLEKRAEEITQVTPPTRRSRARLSSLPSGKKESGKDVNKEIHRYHEMNGALMLSSNEDIFMQRSKGPTSPIFEDCIDIDNEIVQNNRNNNSSGSVLFEESSSIELLQENIIIETSTSDEVGIVRDLNITDRQCSGDMVSINLTIKRNEEDNEVSAPQIAMVEEPELQNSSEKLDLMSNNTFMGNKSEVLHFNENNFDKYIATETPCRVEVRLDGDINEANAALCSIDLMSGINEQENVSLKRTCDTNEQIVTVKEVHIQNRHNATDLMCSRNIMEELNVNENIDKSNVKMPCSSSSHDISTSDMISFKDSNNMNFNENYEDTSDGDGIVLKLDSSRISKLNSSINFRYCDDLAEILPMDSLPHEKHVDVNMEKQYNINNHELPDTYLNYGVSREQTNFIEMDALLRHEHEVYFKKLAEREENPNNDCIHLQNVSKLFHPNINVSNTSNIDSNVEIRYYDSCRLKKEKSTCNIDSTNEFENYLTIKKNHNGETRVLEVQSAHKDDNELGSLGGGDSINLNDYYSKIAFDAVTPKHSKNCSIQISKKDDSSSPDSFNFNDTLDEIERALEKGLNYSMSESPPNTSTSTCLIVEPILNNDTIVENTPLRKKVLKINSSQNIAYKKPTCKYYNILSPVAAYIRSQSPRRINSQFKLPGKQIKQKVSPAVKSKYKSVASPVGVYIKNTPTAPIYEKVTPVKNVQKRMKIYSLENINNKENLSESFPEVIYKPAQHTIMKDNETHLTRKIDCLLPVKSSIIKHEARTINHNSSVSRKLLEDDLTLNKSDSNFDISLQDTSIHSKKRTYISKFPVVKN